MNKPDQLEEAIFNAARQFADSEQLRTYLDAACKNNPEMRRRIERLLGVSSEADDFFQRHAAPAVQPPAPAGVPSRSSGLEAILLEQA
jgi:hypothetical protein